MVLPRSHYGLGGVGTTLSAHSSHQREGSPMPMNAPARPRPVGCGAARAALRRGGGPAARRHHDRSHCARTRSSASTRRPRGWASASPRYARRCARLRGEGMVELEPHRGHGWFRSPAPTSRTSSGCSRRSPRSWRRRPPQRITDERDRRAEPAERRGWPLAVEHREPDEIARRRVHLPPGVQPIHRPDQAGVVSVARRALPAAAPVRRRPQTWGAAAVDSHEQLIAALRRRDVDAVVDLTRGQFTDGAAHG